MSHFFQYLRLFYSLLFLIWVQPCASIEVDHLIIYPGENSQTAKEAILQEIRQATTSIQMSAYQLKEPDIIQALLQAALKGLNIEIILEKAPYQHAFNKEKTETDTILMLLKAGVQFYWCPENIKEKYPKGHYHARYIFIDSKRFLLTTGNFDVSTFDHCRDFAVTFNKDKYPKEFWILQTLFKKDTHDEVFKSSSSPFVIIGPQGQREKIIDFIKTTQKSLKLYQQYFNDPEIVQVISSLIKEKNIKVEILMMPYPTGYDKTDPNAETQDYLREKGARVELILDFYLHARMILVDDTWALIGTTQLSAPSLDHNREVNLIVKGPFVSELLKQFRKDQEKAVSLEVGRSKARELQVDWNHVKHHQ